MIRLVLACLVACAVSYVGTVGHLETWCQEMAPNMWDCGEGEQPGVEVNGQVYEVSE